jgi:hypothetical protein
MVADFTGSGAHDSVLVRVTGDRFGNPLVWSVAVREQTGTLLFYHTACVCDTDEFFGSDEYVVDRIYQGTKRDWYYVDLPGRLIERRRFSPGSPMFDRARGDSFYSIFELYLVEKCRVSSEAARKLAAFLAQKMMKDEVTLLAVPQKPTDHGNSMIFVKELRQFVPIGPW